MTFTHPPRETLKSTESASHFIGELSPDGIASFRKDIFAVAEGTNGTTISRADSNGQPTAEVTRERNESDSSTTRSSSESEEDYDALKIDPSTIVEGGRGGGLEREGALAAPSRRKSSTGVANGTTSRWEALKPGRLDTSRHINQRRKSIQIKLEKTGQKGRYLLTADDPELREILRLGMEREASASSDQKKRHSRFSDLVFTRQFTAFDRQNPMSSESPFHGFFTLFWLGTALLLLKVAAQNWKSYGSVFGSNEIVKLMFHRDVLVLGLTDGVMCASTAFCLLLQNAIFKGYLSWNKEGWILQNIWQTFYLAATIGWTLYREWPWTHTIFIVLHCLVMLMKQHSYGFYNGYLSEVYKRRKILESKLSQLKDFEPVATPSATSPAADSVSSSWLDVHSADDVTHRRRSLNTRSSPQLHRQQNEVAEVATAIEAHRPLDNDQIQSFKRIITWEIEMLTEELNGKCSDSANYYPRNLDLKNFSEYIVLPTCVYELEYPRQEHIKWSYVIEKTAATFGVLGVMIVISQAYIYPVVVQTVRMKEAGMPLRERLEEFPWLLVDLLFPFMMEYLLVWYVIWECILNVLAELTRFADRGFYADWWNSVSWDQYARDWNRPVHNFLLRHVYHSSISAFHLTRSSATLVTFLLSACVHELIMWCLFKKLRGYLMAMQMLQLPLVSLSRTKLLKGRDVIGNLVFWIGLFTGPSLMCTLYLVI
ncbi:MAG: acyl-CoA/sterol acyltransferase [Pycnora praestabilis]|nr:MAG: acyl-CoA/sterol acyltransferase [Pycnora praestabilis]